MQNLQSVLKGVPSKKKRQNIYSDLEKCVRSTASVVSGTEAIITDRSTVFGGSEIRSLMGPVLTPQQRSQIADWVPPIPEELSSIPDVVDHPEYDSELPTEPTPTASDTTQQKTSIASRTLEAIQRGVKGKRALIKACQFPGDLEKVKLLLRLNVDPNLKDASGTDALHYAALYGHEGIVELLLKNGADVSAADNRR